MKAALISFIISVALCMMLDVVYIKAYHIVSIISWMVGIFYLPRIFVYYVKYIDYKEALFILQEMAYKLYNIIMTPAAVASIISGLFLAKEYFMFKEPWLHIKMLFVFLLLMFHFFLGSRLPLKNFLHKISEKQWRFINEIPTVLLIIIVYSVVVKGL